MAGLFMNDPTFVGGKYLVLRRDDTVPAWPYFVLGASDPAAPIALRAYADACESLGKDPQYVSDLRRRADEFEAWRLEHGEGDPDAPRHRIDCPAVIERMRYARAS